MIDPISLSIIGSIVSIAVMGAIGASVATTSVISVGKAVYLAKTNTDTEQKRKKIFRNMTNTNSVKITISRSTSVKMFCAIAGMITDLSSKMDDRELLTFCMGNGKENIYSVPICDQSVDIYAPNNKSRMTITSVSLLYGNESVNAFKIRYTKNDEDVFQNMLAKVFIENNCTKDSIKAIFPNITLE